MPPILSDFFRFLNLIGDALVHQSTNLFPISGPPDYSFALDLLVTPLNYHSGVGRDYSVTFRVFIL